MKSKKRRWLKRIAAAVLACAVGTGSAAALVGCSSDSGSNKNEMSVAWTSNAGEYNLDPTNNYMGWQGSYLGIYEQLFRIDGNFDPQPMLAESAEMVNDTTWKITLREGVTFQNGDALDAQAVKDCLNRTMEMNARAKKSLDIAGMEADGKVLTVTTNSLNRACVNVGCERVASIIDVNCGAEDEKPVGTGPYKIDSVASNGDVELSAYDSYWQGEPNIKTVHAKYLTDDQSKVSALQSGEVSALMNVADDQLAALSDTSKYTLHQTNQARAHMLYFNMQSDLMRDDAVREAVGLCVDRSSYVSSIYNNSAEAAHAVFPDSSGYAEDVTCDGFDVEKAKRLLADAGYADTDGDGVLEKDGKKLSLKIVTYQANAALPKDCEALSSQLSQIGIASEIEVAEKISSRLGQSDWEIGTMAYSTLPTGNPYTYLSTVMGAGGASNYGHYSNAKVDALLGQLKQTSDEAKQKELVKQIQKIALDDHAYVYMVHTLVNDVTASNVQNLAMQGQYDWLNYQMSYK